MKRIHYGMGSEYLKDWGNKEALREIYQNFLDEGSYTENIEENGDNVKVTIMNDWAPKSLDFLRIGNSNKRSKDAIGKHGEGLKMAFMVFLRNGIQCELVTGKHVVRPGWYEDEDIGKCYCLEYETNDGQDHQFTIEFTMNKEEFMSFHRDIIRDEDIEFSDNHYGDIVNKEVGKIYCGRLFVAKIPRISKSYNINPSELPLDRDRRVPKSFEVNWATSKINEAHGKFTAEDLSHSDTMYVDKVPEDIKKQIKPVMVGNSVEFKFKTKDGETKMLQNDRVKEILKKDSLFAKIIKKMKVAVMKKLGLYDLLIEFRDKHVHSQEALNDFNMILEKVSKPKEKEEVHA